MIVQGIDGKYYINPVFTDDKTFIIRFQDGGATLFSVYSTRRKQIDCLKMTGIRGQLSTTEYPTSEILGTVMVQGYSMGLRLNEALPTGSKYLSKPVVTETLDPDEHELMLFEVTIPVATLLSYLYDGKYNSFLGHWSKATLFKRLPGLKKYKSTETALQYFGGKETITLELG